MLESANLGFRMPDMGQSDDLVRFEAFELDTRTGELFKDGTKIVHLSEQPLRIMLALLERPGELVLREDLRRRLWPNDTIVEFEHSINAAMKRLRQALGDSAEEPHFIETLPRRGYRWKTTAHWVKASLQARKPPAPAPNQSLVGKRVTHYRVLEVLGGGGMGLVYKAEDLKLGRRVALKFLPEELVADPLALERFRREARAASVPDHPNICTIYEVGEYESAPFIAMQLLQGQTLSERIESLGHTPMPLDELLTMAIQITEGLGAAHQLGIIHRDIKPANIFLTNRGEAKILDFGLAKLSDTEDHAERSVVSLPVIKAADSDLSLTRTGAAIGTASYMSPEQVRGEKLDGRTDLFSIGLVLYEAATSRRPFARASAAEVHDAVLHATPVPVRSLNPALPREFELLIERALRKDRASRYQSAAELRADLERVHAQVSSSRPRVTKSRSIRFSGPLPYVAGVLLIVLLAVRALQISRRTSSVAELRLTQLTWNSSELPVRSAKLSPDGKYLAYSDLNGIHIKNLSSNETRTVPEPDSIHDSRVDWSVISWFPDGTRFIAEIAPFGEGCAGCDHFSTWMVSILGGPPRMIHDRSAAESISPDGRLIAFTSVLGSPGGREVWLMDAAGDQSKKLFATDQQSWMRYARWSSDGQRLAYVHVHETPGRNSTLESRPLHGGDPVVIIPNANAVHDFIWASDGSIIYGLEERAGNACNYWKLKVNSETGQPEGQPHRITNWAGFCLDATSATADGKRLAFTEVANRGSIYVAEMQNGAAGITSPVRLSLMDAPNRLFGWTKDSKCVLFSSARGHTFGLYKQALGSDVADAILSSGGSPSSEASISPDGKWLLYVGGYNKPEPLGVQQLMRVSMEGGSPRSVLSGRLWGVRCPVSPSSACVLKEWNDDGKQLIFSTVDPEKGRGPQIFRMSSDDDTNWAISPDGTKIALFGAEGKPLRIKSLRELTELQVSPKGWKGLDFITWANDSKGLYGSSPTQRGDVLLHLDLRGNVHNVWQLRGSFQTSAIPSPDGRHLAIQTWHLSGNVWMMEDF